MNRIGGAGIWVVVLAIAMDVGGCSFVFEEAPPQAHATLPYFDCTSTYGLATADGVFAAGGLSAGISTFRKSKQEFADQNGGASRNAAGGIDIAVAATFAASAVYGVIQSSRCATAKRELQARIARSTPALSPLVPPAAGPTLAPSPVTVPSSSSPAPVSSPAAEAPIGSPPPQPPDAGREPGGH
ncbi:MAG TPA: hypothetical protein VHM31_03570 [Polyangia bacterium]|nr:hypothetical protein [Polyangia bacterium]HVY36979.1 hypothetical protein [Polyangia bacterium]